MACLPMSSTRLNLSPRFQSHVRTHKQSVCDPLFSDYYITVLHVYQHVSTYVNFELYLTLFQAPKFFLLTLGTHILLFYNGVMLGSFFTFFYNRDLLFEASKSVWLHGTIEISVIVIAGCAGLVMGNSILFPKTYSRRVSFLKGAKDGLKIVVSTIPFFILAGFIEGFITRYSNMPVWLSMTIIFSSLVLIVYYYIIYPYRLNERIK